MRCIIKAAIQAMLKQHLEPSCLLEVRRTYALADNVPLISTRHNLHLLLFHNFLQLLSHLMYLENNTQQQILHVYVVQ